MTTFTAANLSAAMGARERATGELAKLTARAKGRALTANERARESALLDSIRENDAVVREAVANGAAIEDQSRSGLVFREQTSADTSRSLGDVRVFGMPLSETRSAMWTDVTQTGETLVTDVLSASGSGSKLLPLVRTSEFFGSHGRIAVAPRLKASLNGQADPLTALDNPVKSGTFAPLKIDGWASVDRDDFTDYPQVEEALNIALADAVGAAADAFILNGGTTSDHTAEGIIAGGVDTTVSALDAAALFGAVARVRNTGGEATAIVANPDEVAGILANVDGSKIDRLPPLVAIPDGADGTPVIAAGKALVADLRAVYVAVRQGMQVFKTTEEPSVHARDAVLIGGRARVCNPKVATAGRVQVLTVSAA